MMSDSTFNTFYQTYINPLKEQLLSINQTSNTEEINRYVESILSTRLGNYSSMINSNFSLLSNLFKNLTEEEVQLFKNSFVNVYDEISTKLYLLNDNSDKEKLLNNVNECLNVLNDFEKSIKLLQNKYNGQKDLISVLNEYNSSESSLDNIEHFYDILTDILDLLKANNIHETDKNHILKIMYDLVIKGYELNDYKSYIDEYQSKISKQEYDTQVDNDNYYINRLINIEKECEKLTNDDQYTYMLVTLLADTDLRIKSIKEILSGKNLTDDEESMTFDSYDRSAIISNKTSYDFYNNISESAFVKNNDKVNSLEEAGLLEAFIPEKEESKTDTYIDDIMSFINKKSNDKYAESKSNINSTSVKPIRHSIKQEYSKTIKSVSSKKYDDLKKRHDEIAYTIQNKLQRNQKITLKEAFEECKLRKQLELVKLSVNDILKIIRFNYASNNVTKVRKNNLCKDKKIKKGIFSKKLNVQKAI